MIDLHCHILPGVDDGAATLAESCYMARLAAADGIKTIVATPHACNGIYRNDPHDTMERVAALNGELARTAIPLQVVPGAEVRLIPNLNVRLRRGEANTINNGRYVLIALPPVLALESVQGEIAALRMSGYLPIIAHPERHTRFRHDFDRLHDFVELGVLCQITAASLTGGFGRDVKNVAEKMILNGMAHVLGTDSHAASWREPVLSAALQRAERLLGSREAARRLVKDIPGAIIADKDIAMEIPTDGKP